MQLPGTARDPFWQRGKTQKHVSQISKQKHKPLGILRQKSLIEENMSKHNIWKKVTYLCISLCAAKRKKKQVPTEPVGKICDDRGINEEEMQCANGTAPVVLRSAGDLLSLSPCILLQGFLVV